MAKRKKKNKKKKQKKIRNDTALAAIFQPGIKTHPDKKKKENKEKCREKVEEKE